jgi:hypothetical protein
MGVYDCTRGDHTVWCTVPPYPGKNNRFTFDILVLIVFYDG